VTPEDGNIDIEDETQADTSGVSSAGALPNNAHPPASASAAAPETTEASDRLYAQIEQDIERPLPWRSIAKKTAALVLAGITIYLFFPSLVAVFSSFPKLTSLDPIWFTLALGLEVAHFACTFALQRIALRTTAWYSVATSSLAGNAISLVVPGGAAVGAATQFRMLAAAGNDTATTVGGLTVFSLLQIGGLLALPIFVLPAILAGTPIAHGLEYTALLGLVAFVLFAGFGAAVLVLDGPICWIGHVVQVARNRFRRTSVPMTDLPERLLSERNRIRDVLGKHWKAATLLSSGRLLLDFGCLLASIKATGASPNPSLVLLAYSVAKILQLIPITPGGLGLVEAGLTGLLILGGLSSGAAVIATLAYRIISYWLPIFAGPFAYVAFRSRYGPPGRNHGGSGGRGPAMASS
jgi:hypothetical protein